MTPSAQRVLITGGAGFIGSHLAEALIRRGDQVVIVDSLDSFYPVNWKRENLQEIARAGDYEFVHADIRDEVAIRDLFERTRPQTVIHLAARAGVRPSIAEPLLYEQVNLFGTVTLLEMCRRFGVTRFLFGSSSSIYGDTMRLPFTEDETDLRPLSPYAATKMSGEMLAYTYAHLHGLEVVCLRFFTVYGPRQRPDLAIYKFTELLEAGKKIPIFGDGSTGRDYTYVDDIVAGVIAAREYKLPSGSAPFEVFNLGNSHPLKLSDLVSLLEQATGRAAIQEHLPMQPGDVRLTWADVSRASRLLGYRPATRIEVGLARFVAWYREAAPSRAAAASASAR